MGSQLRRDLREALGPGIKGLPRSVALEIADDARYDDNWNYEPEKGRRSRATLEQLRRWTASKDTNVVRDALKRLSSAGWEFRIPIGQGKDGRVLFAVPGRAVEFRVPDFELKGESPLPLIAKGESRLPLEGVTTPSEGVTTPCRASQDYPPPISFITDPPTSPTAPATKPAGNKRKPKSVAALKPNKHQVADDLTAAFWDMHGKGRAQGFLAVRGVVRTAIGNGVERDDLARALDLIAREGRFSISGSTVDVALGKIKRPGGQTRSYQDPEDQDDYDKEIA